MNDEARTKRLEGRVEAKCQRVPAVELPEAAPESPGSAEAAVHRSGARRTETNGTIEIAPRSHDLCQRVCLTIPLELSRVRGARTNFPVVDASSTGSEQPRFMARQAYPHRGGLHFPSAER